MQQHYILFDHIVESGADFSNDRKYRYALWRIWDKSKPLIMFIGLNPSTANETENDPTIKSVTRIANNNGYGGFYMMNCFAYITADPKLLKHNPMSDEWNNNKLIVIASKCKDVVFAWGNFKIVRELERDIELYGMFPNAKVIAFNKNYSPKHPLYIKSDTKLIPFRSKELNEPTFEEDEIDFEPCSDCDLPDACHDYGCAIKQGLKDIN